MESATPRLATLPLILRNLMPPSPDLVITDPVYQKKAKPNILDTLGIRLINDVRDLPFLKLSLLIGILLIPGALYLFLAPKFSWLLAAVYLMVLFGMLLGPYILMLHNICHRKLFKPNFERLNYLIVWILGPLCGQTPETYFAHHIGMHHQEENLPNDLSSTMKYRRDSFVDFLRYFGRFYFYGLVELGQYLINKRRNKIFRKMVLGEIAWYGLIILLCIFNWRATLVVFIIPLVVTRFMMMNGNWAQHAFISPTEPNNDYQNSITCINSRYNRTCFNDGYHIGHHVQASRHWTDMPKDFLQNKQRYIDEKAVVFRKIDYFAIWIFLMLKRYDWLAHFFVDLDTQNPRSQSEIISLLKQRTQPFDSDALQAWA